MFANRTDAGRRLAAALGEYRDHRPVVLALPRGGVVVGHPIAEALDCPLDIVVVRKLGAPGQPELGLGAIAEHGSRVVNDELVRYLRISTDALDRVEEREREELRRRVRRYRRNRPEVDVHGRTAIVVDDGLATGYTARAAVAAARARGAARVILAVPVGAPDVVDDLGMLADRVVALSAPPNLRAVGFWYRDFAQTTDDEVLTLLDALTATSEEDQSEAVFPPDRRD